MKATGIRQIRRLGQHEIELNDAHKQNLTRLGRRRIQFNRKVANYGFSLDRFNLDKINCSAPFPKSA